MIEVMLAMIVFFVLGILLLLYGSFAISGEHFHNPVGNSLFLLVLVAIGLLCLIALANPIIKRLPKGFRKVIDDDMRDDGSFDTSRHAIAICILKDNKLVQLMAEDRVYSIPIELIEDSLHIDSTLNNFVLGLGLTAEDLFSYTDYGAFLPGVKELVTCHVFRCIGSPSVPGNYRLVDSTDITELNALEKQLIIDLKKEGAVG